MLKFYYDLMSQPSRALYLFIKLNKIPFEDCKVALRKAEHQTEEFEKINPFKRVPAIVHDDFRLAESIAIVRYLHNNYDIADHWYPKDVKVRAKVDEFLEWHHLNLRMFGSLLFQVKLIYPLMTGEPVNQRRVDNALDGLKRSLDSIENIFLAKGPYIHGRTEFSVADVFCACEIEQPLSVGFDRLSDYPRTTAWFKLVKEQLNPEYDQVHTYIHNVKQKLKSNM